jgi:electron transfer flavoprotein alpha subunit
MATVRPGILRPARPEPQRRVTQERLEVPATRARVRVLAQQLLTEESAPLDAAPLVIGVGRGIGGPAALPAITALAARLGAGLAATREVTDAGWLPSSIRWASPDAIAPRSRGARLSAWGTW